MLTSQQLSVVYVAVENYLQLAAETFSKKYPIPEISFDLHARAAGQYRLKKSQHQLRFNPVLFQQNFEVNLQETVPHEVAHYVTFKTFGRVKPHGDEWKQVMALFGAEPSVTHDQNVSAINTRQERRWRYRCACQEHLLTTRRHYKILRGTGHYFCKSCGQEIQSVS